MKSERNYNVPYCKYSVTVCYDDALGVCDASVFIRFRFSIRFCE